MIHITCHNPACPAGGFDWDETTRLGDGDVLAEPGQKGAVRFVTLCPACGTRNTIWVLKASVPRTPVYRKSGISKDRPLK